MNVPSPTPVAATPGDNDHAGSDFVGGIPHGFSARLDRAYERFTQGDLAGAIADCNEVIQLDPRCVDAYRILAECHYAQRDYPGVIADCEAALRIDPFCAPAYNTRGAARLALGDLGGAVSDCNAALRINPQFCGAYVTRGNARYHQGDAGGMFDYRKAFQIDPAIAAKGLISLIRFQLRQGGSELLANCEKHLQKNPGDVMSYARRGLALLIQGEEAEAQKDFDRFRLLNPAGTGNLELLITEAMKYRRP